MGIQKCKTTVLIKRILLNVHSGGIDMCSQDVKTILHGLLSHAEQADSLVHPDAVYTVSLFQLLSLCDGLLQLHKAFFFSAVYNLIHALPLRLCFADEFDIFCRKIIAGFLHFQIISDPRIHSFHFHRSLPPINHLRSSMPSSSRPFKIFSIARVTSASSRVFSLFRKVRL